jgi:hypothetical protein
MCVLLPCKQYEPQAPHNLLYTCAMSCRMKLGLSHFILHVVHALLLCLGTHPRHISQTTTSSSSKHSCPMLTSIVSDNHTSCVVPASCVCQNVLLNHPKAVSAPAAMLQQQSHESDANSTKGISDKSPVRTTIIITVSSKHQSTMIHALGSKLWRPHCSPQQYAAPPHVARGCCSRHTAAHQPNNKRPPSAIHTPNPGCCACCCRCTCKASRPNVALQ